MSRARSAKEDEEEFLERISKMLQEMTPDCEAAIWMDAAWILHGEIGCWMLLKHSNL